MKHNYLVNKKHKKVSKVLNYNKHSPFLVFAIIGCVLISAFPSFIGIPIGIMSSIVGLKFCAIAAEIKKYKLIIKKKNHDKIVLLAKTKLNITEVLISKGFTDSYISHDEFVSVNNVLREYDDMKK